MSLRQLPKAVKEIRLHLCQSGASSAGVRQFIKSSYPALKEANPDVKVLIREAQGVNPRAFVRLERGVEHQASLDGLAEKDVASALSKLAGQ
ncbi:NADH dehydrogenase 10.5K chain [Trichosporon asahii var. asahii CBS 8904]|uniref:NADH dehydrogenase 10.5K chain n=2 Tax=Trichosporon asahii var. asahii TaxID=189963 RepID=K1VZT3_TRIAC|nr:NADH dehydrogenase 10.5K chain [Trichosporon asahii var. asahii CBS 2479]EJT53119.1 NADH dehydrogenase 10.5K chain [Trichosporon asahii var. asahii CBS 2479]EKD02313.1 NADH dehydrogenase 10.5K chain [Trichosporon asahii var. asahii CBS 8904]